jgi:hypothetical protein
VRRLLAAVGAATLITGAATFVAPSRAVAAPEHCERGANGFVDIPDTLTGTVVRHHDLYGGPPGGVRVELHRATIGGVGRGWAKITGFSTGPGDQVWMDWTQNGGAGWLQCGPFTITAVGQTKTSAAQRTNPSTQWLFRACGKLSWWTWAECTTWW